MNRCGLHDAGDVEHRKNFTVCTHGKIRHQGKTHMTLISCTPELTLLPLDLPKTGFHQFIATWLMCIEGRYVLLDPGPSCSIPTVLAGLKEMGISSLEGVILTHIHLDHAGGIGHLLQKIPVDWVLAHPQAHRHLIDPTALWKGSLKVLGDLAQLYGPLLPVPSEILRYETDLMVGSEVLNMVETPGHAPHHLAVLWRDFLFAGEAVGVSYPSQDSPYLRPATPPTFLPDVFLASSERLQALPHLPPRICYGHFGMRDDALFWIQQGHEQTQRWLRVLEQSYTETEDEIFQRLLAEDSWFSAFHALPEDIQQRERYFVSNSIRGMGDYFRNKQSEASGA